MIRSVYGTSITFKLSVNLQYYREILRVHYTLPQAVHKHVSTVGRTAPAYSLPTLIMANSRRQ